MAHSDQPELTVSVDRGANKRGAKRSNGRAPTMPNFAQAAEANADVAEAVRARRRSIHNQHAASKGAAQQMEEDAPKPPSVPVEDQNLDSVELDMPNGLKVLLGPPPNVSLTMRVLQYYGDQQSWALADEGVTRALMCVREIDGKPYPAVTNPVDRQMLGNKLGDDGIAICVLTHRRYFPLLRLTELPVIKKNQRIG